MGKHTDTVSVVKDRSLPFRAALHFFNKRILKYIQFIMLQILGWFSTFHQQWCFMSGHVSSCSVCTLAGFRHQKSLQRVKIFFFFFFHNLIQVVEMCVGWGIHGGDLFSVFANIQWFYIWPFLYFLVLLVEKICSNLWDNFKQNVVLAKPMSLIHLKLNM